MKRLIFNPVFVFLLIAVLIFVAMPAMAFVEIGISGTFTPDDPNTPENEQQLVAKLTYSVAPDPKPTIDDIIITPTTFVNTFDEGSDGDPKTYFITWSELPSDFASSVFSLTLAGYRRVRMGPPGISFHSELPGQQGEHIVEKLILMDNHLPGLGYVIIAANDTAIAGNVYPTLPILRAPNTITKKAWSVVSDETLMPDLYDLFAVGGTLNLRVNVPGTTHRLGSKLEDGTYDDDTNRNQRQVVINEVMWAHDQSYLGVADNLVREQWIELYNRTTTPIAFSDIKLITSKQDPAPPAETDRLSNVPSYINTWEITNRGQHGSSITPRREFKSMQRINYDDGWHESHWRTAVSQYLRYYFGSPGTENRRSTVRPPRTPPTKDTPPKNKIIVNEIGNLTDNQLDWIELRNVTGSAQSLHNWVLTKTTGFGDETEIIRFPDYSIEPRGMLLLVNRHPGDTPISLGFDIKFPADDQEFGSGPHKFLILDDDKLEIPNDDGWLLILRSGNPWDVGENRDVYQTGFRVEDVAGPGALHDNFVLRDLTVPTPQREKKADGQPTGEIWDTKVFPLNGNTQPDADFLQNDRLNTPDTVWIRDDSKQGYLKDAWVKAGFTGIGYDRRGQANDQNSGTPGYDNSVVRGKISQLDGGKLIVSELMLTTATTGNRSLPQWIELHNTSKTRGIDLAADDSDPKTGWQLIVENHDSGSWKENKRPLNITINLKDLFTYILPNQTVLIVAYEDRPSERDYFPDSRVASIYAKKSREFGMANRTDLFLNAEGGFYIKIVDGAGVVSDEIGNLDGLEPNLRQGIGLDDPFSWNWPTDLTEDRGRTSLIRRRDESGRPRIAVPNRNVEGDLTGAVLQMGIKRARYRNPKYAWVHAVDTAFKRVPKIWYGDSDDIGTPGFIRGTPLPVNLSSFRPALENGEIVIRWTTESELNNAGFNILRSDSRDGEFRQVNTELIQGAGTTGEQQVYKWVDTSAKTGAVYYYQIEDVSFAGERQTLITAKLKGLISARNKAATVWGELKSKN